MGATGGSRPVRGSRGAAIRGYVRIVVALARVGLFTLLLVLFLAVVAVVRDVVTAVARVVRATVVSKTMAGGFVGCVVISMLPRYRRGPPQ